MDMSVSEKKSLGELSLIYSSDEFEREFTYSGNDLGALYSKSKTIFKVWAPTALSIAVKLYKTGDVNNKDCMEIIPMAPGDNGTWFLEKNGDLSGIYYTYFVNVNGSECETVDPYAKATGVNGMRAMVADMSITNPIGWEEDHNPHSGESITDAIIYEGHIRDLTVKNTNIINKGKYLGLVELPGKGTVEKVDKGMDKNDKISFSLISHLQDLGITHLHILPMFDFGSVDERLTNSDQYNWGYDPVNFNVPEGSFSTNPFDGYVRIKELKEMIHGLHQAGISVIMDVVYNHVHDAENFSVNCLVPGYFSRISSDGTYSNGSVCGNDTASERSMVRKFIVDSVCYWADEYHIDGFRFDLVGLIDTKTINEIVDEVKKKHSDVIFYGEGWNLDTKITRSNVNLATQCNAYLTPDFAYFNDTIRDGLKGSVFDKSQGYVSGNDSYKESIINCIKGADRWCNSPKQTVNYVSCHDNNTLFDRLHISCPDEIEDNIIKMNKLAATIYFMSQGVPFLQAGEEILRSKVNKDGSFEENSYNAGDEINAVDFSYYSNSDKKKTYDYYKGLIAFRKAHEVLRLGDASNVSKCFNVLDTGSEKVIAIHLDGAQAKINEEVILLFNTGREQVAIELPDGQWEMCVDEERSGAECLGVVREEVSINPISAKVLVKCDYEF